MDAVLEQTLAELADAGVEGLSVERIARRAQVNKTSVYRRWPTRDALIAAALEGVLAQAHAQVPDTGSLQTDLVGLLRPVAALLEDPRGQALARAAFSAGAAKGVGAMAARALGRPPPAPLRALVARAKARGEWRAGVKPEDVIFTVVGAMLHRAMLEQRPLSPRWLRARVQLVLKGASPLR